MKKIFRKAVTVLGSVALVGATIGGAAAAAYPAPFDAGNAAVVVGSSAAASDNAAGVKIAQDVGITAVADSAEATVTGGDSYLMERTSTKFGVGDYVADVITATVDDDELPTLLADGKFVDDDNDEFDYTQKIELVNASLRASMFDDNDYKDDTPTLGMKLTNGVNILNYTLDFTDKPEWRDLTTSTLPFMGKEYYVLSNGTLGTDLTLLDSAVDTVLAEGESTTLNVNGKAYVVSVDFISDTETLLTVNGESTNTLNEAETQKLSDGSYIGVKDILYTSKDTGVSKVEFSIGSGKLKLTNDTNVELNDESISGLKTIFTTTGGSGATAKLAKIVVQWDADDDLFVASDSEVIMPGFEAVKLSMADVTYDAEETITITNDGDSSIVLDNFPTDDTTEDINILYYNNSHYNLTGEDSEHILRTSGNGTLNFDGDTDEWFVLSWNDSQDHESYILRFSSFENTSSTQRADLQQRQDGAWVTIQSDVDGASSPDTFDVGSVTITIDGIDQTSKTANITTTTTGASFNKIYSKEGMMVQLPWMNKTDVTQTTTNVTACASIYSVSDSLGQLGYEATMTLNNGTSITCAAGPSYRTHYHLYMKEQDKNDNLAAGYTINVSFTETSSNDKVLIYNVDMGAVEGSFSEQGDTDKFRNFAYSDLATEAVWDKSGTQDMPLTLTYHGEEVALKFYITSPEATVSGNSGTLTFKDTETSSFSGKNIVVVGGSCVNAIAAELLGSQCGDSFTSSTGVMAGEALIETFNYNGKIATVVAGYDAADTTNAANYLVGDNDEVDTIVGSKYKVTSATEATVVTA